MSDSDFSRRNFIKNSVTLVGSYPLLGNFFDDIVMVELAPEDGVKLTWLNKTAHQSFGGATCGVCWRKGKVNKKNGFVAIDSQNRSIDVQSWPLAYWPDGSLKWTGHAFSNTIASSENIFIKPVKSTSIIKGLTVTESSEEIIIDTGVIRCVIAKKGEIFLRSVSRNQKEIIKNGKLILLLQDQPDNETSQVISKETFQGTITEAKLEQQGPIKTVIKITGTHVLQKNGKQLIPFVVRMYFYHNGDSIRLLHTLIYDGDESQHFIKGVGLSFNVPLKDEQYNRHVRFINSEHDGIFAEAVKGLTGLRRDAGKEIKEQQLSGKAVTTSAFPGSVSGRLQYIPSFGDYTLYQPDAGSFTIRKRTSVNHSWIHSAQGHRAAGVVYLGTPNGGMVAGIKNFWQSFPAQLDIRKAGEDIGVVNLWLWAPDAPAMDLRFYHDGMGQDTFPKQREGLEITYEDYEPGFGTPKGVARTSEVFIWAVDATPSRESLLEMAAVVQNPPTLVCDIMHLEKEKVFGGNWSLVDRSTPEKVLIETQLDQYFEFYKKQIDQHKWYGFWNYGDVMHSYDADRHTWKYDVGGCAWDNSELSTDLWLWYYFLHTGRADVFRMAEAMTRHTGEVDVHHLGPFAPLGSRHNVMHWGCSAKQLRISTAANRRIYYYLTGDERVGDLMEEQVDAAKKLADIVPGRKLPNRKSSSPNLATSQVVSAGFGTDWGAIAAAWLTRWERTGDPSMKEKLINSMKTIALQPKGFFTGSGRLDLSTGKFMISEETSVSVSHLSAVFGLTETCSELIQLIDVPEFTRAWLQYCRLYNAPPEEQRNELGQTISGLNLQQGHSRLTAFAANHLKDENLAIRAWKEFYGRRERLDPVSIKINKLRGSEVLSPIDEAISVSTNSVAQWGLAAIQCLAYVGKFIQR